MRKLEKYCKNCGARIDDSDQFCPDCGKVIGNATHPIRHCPNCGERITGEEHFCKSCGFKLMEVANEKPGFLNRHKNLIIVAAAIAVIAVVAVGAISIFAPIGDQQVDVDSFTFSIPQDFEVDDDLTVNESEDGISYVSKYMQNGNDSIQIDVMYSQSDIVDANDVLNVMDGDAQSMMGYDGYFEEYSDAYAFTFVKDNKIITVYTTDYDLFDQIEVL